MEPIIVKTDLLKDMIMQMYIDYPGVINYRFIKIYNLCNNYDHNKSRFTSIKEFTKRNTWFSDTISVFIIPNEFDFSGSFLSDAAWHRNWDIFDINTQLKLKELIASYMLFI